MALSSLVGLSIEYTHQHYYTSNFSQKHCLKVMPLGKKSRQRIAIADHMGVLTVLQPGKNLSNEIVFQTIPDKVGCGALEIMNEQIYISCGNQITSYSKKGKKLFALKTNISENITALQVDAPYINFSGLYVLNRFKDTNEVGYYMAPDQINDILMQPINRKTGEQDTFLACNNRSIQTIRDYEFLSELKLDSIPTVLNLYANNNDVKAKTLLYGTQSGTLGIATIGTENELIRMNAIKPDKSSGIINTIAVGDVMLDGSNHIICGYDSGAIEIHSIDKNPDGLPYTIWSGNIGECVNSIAIGRIISGKKNDFIVHGYSGKVNIFSMSDKDSSILEEHASTFDNNQINKLTDNSISYKKCDIQSSKVENDSGYLENLKYKKKILKEQIKNAKKQLAVKKDTLNSYLSANKLSINKLNVICRQAKTKEQDALKYKLKSCVEDNYVYAIYIETAEPLNYVCISSDKPLTIIQSGKFCSSAIIDSYIVPSNKDGNSPSPFTAIATCVENETKRLCIRISLIEGLATKLQLHIILKADGIAKTEVMRILPLQMHQPIQPDSFDSKSLDSITLTGEFSVKEAHAWLGQCLPEIPDKYTGPFDSKGELFYKEYLLNTVLHITYRKSEIVCISNNPFTLHCLQNIMSLEATKRSINIKLAHKTNPEVIDTIVDRMIISIKDYFVNKHEMQLLLALREVRNSDDQFSMCTNSKSIMDRSVEIESQYEEYTIRGNIWKDIAVNMLSSCAALKGIVATNILKDSLLTSISNEFNIAEFRDVFSNL